MQKPVRRARHGFTCVQQQYKYTQGPGQVISNVTARSPVFLFDSNSACHRTKKCRPDVGRRIYAERTKPGSCFFVPVCRSLLAAAVNAPKERDKKTLKPVEVGSRHSHQLQKFKMRLHKTKYTNKLRTGPECIPSRAITVCISKQNDSLSFLDILFVLSLSIMTIIMFYGDDYLTFVI